jgi:hypothetical protein
MKRETAVWQSSRLRCFSKGLRLTECLRNSVTLLAISIIAVLALDSANAQEHGFPSPATTGVLGKRDAGALTEVNAYLMAVGAGGWQSLEATGSLTYPDGSEHTASLYLSGSRFQRLDIEFGSGTRSLRLGGFAGRYQSERGNRGSLPPATSSAGIVAFPRIWADAATSASISLYDQHLYAGTGSNLHRITVDYALEDPGGNRIWNKTAATDLYFNPGTHLLNYSVDAVKFNVLDRQPFQRVTSYEQYQKFSGISVPTVIKQYLNGQLQWTLQLNQVTINSNPATSAFSF